MKILTPPGSVPSGSTWDKRTVTISIRRAAVASATLAPNRTEETALAGAVLAGLALSQTLFHAKAVLARETAAHAKLRL